MSFFSTWKKTESFIWGPRSIREMSAVALRMTSRQRKLRVCICSGWEKQNQLRVQRKFRTCGKTSLRKSILPHVEQFKANGSVKKGRAPDSHQSHHVKWKAGFGSEPEKASAKNESRAQHPRSTGHEVLLRHLRFRAHRTQCVHQLLDEDYVACQAFVCLMLQNIWRRWLPEVLYCHWWSNISH
jgi:hypothetical protein